MNQWMRARLGTKLRTRNRATPPSQPRVPKQSPSSRPEADTPLWTEALLGAEILLLHAMPVYYGFGVPRGDGSGVVIIPGFLGTDLYMMELHGWLERIGYRAYFSGIGINADCPNLLIKGRLNETIKRALDETGHKVHLIGHSLGGVIARSIAGARPKDIASVITLASPIRGTVMNRAILNAAEAVRLGILKEHGKNVLPECYTGGCTCRFINSLRREVPDDLLQTAIYTRSDGIVDWRYCRTGKAEMDFEVRGTHIGMAFNATAYSIVGQRLALTHPA